MFISKLQSLLHRKVPVNRQIHNTVTKLYLLFKSPCNKTSKKSSNAKNVSPKCKEYQDKLAKCPKPTFEQLCCKPLFPKPEPKCEPKIIENYDKVYKDITDHTKSILTSVSNESKLILNRFEDDIELMKSKETAQLQEFSYSVKERLDELTSLDPSCVSLKRKCALSLNYQVQQAFNNVQCDIVPKLEKVKEALKILERDVLTCVDNARSLILMCRKCNSPQALSKCIEVNADATKQMLDETFKSMQDNLHKVEALRQETLRYHEKSIAEVTEIYRVKYKAFLKHLDKCIATLKNCK